MSAKKSLKKPKLTTQTAMSEEIKALQQRWEKKNRQKLPPQPTVVDADSTPETKTNNSQLSN